ncbi:uncharacterized protein LOC124622404 [Schistocerca americana]|uniref:uncharacterized protein LOC124622404 n=1 Tax=Schistocerca americana TaxID=7009 RepID=UPI001F4F4DF9|nr:uncharacterized protein LOC124622404 [Schistocerca americana]XP_047121758.1 uncharacterized protein LOC124805291 [Schistocerca piceifrons]XP_049937803.1 uncharacterized protein LOC126412326 [Schistocerca serialis cubense]
MFPLLLLVLPLLAEGASSDSVGCVLQDASTELFYITTEEKPWYQQYQYKVPGLFDLGCVTYVQSPGETMIEMNLTGNFSKVPFFPLNCVASATGNGNRIDKVYEGVWKSLLSGPYNIVYSHEDFIMDRYCFLGYEVAQIFTTVKEPSDKLMEMIWEIVGNHSEVDRSKFQKVVC